LDLVTEKYTDHLKYTPQKGKHILAHQTSEQIVVYQAFNSLISKFAVDNQFLGGANYSYDRMSWIKPNFLWMMYRSGWAEKTNQENILAIWIDKIDFEGILSKAVHSSYQDNIYNNKEFWKAELYIKNVRLQWDPDHDIFGDKLERRAIQLGLKGNILEKFAKKMINKIENITPFVKEQKSFLDTGRLDKLLLPKERKYHIDNKKLDSIIGVCN
jgi:Domain of unknown function (DUF4291)